LKEKNNPSKVWQEYQGGIQYNNALYLYENVKKQENFYLGRQWEGLNAPDLEQPVLNFLGRVVNYFISMLVSDDVGISVNSFTGELPNPLLNMGNDELVAKEIERVIEKAKIKSLNRDALRNAAVDGDTCFYLHFDPNKGRKISLSENEVAYQGEIAVEVLDNTNVIFANPYSDNLQEQPYIIVVQRKPIKELRKQAQKEGVKNWESIISDNNSLFYNEDKTDNNDLVTVLTKFYRNRDTIKYYRCTQSVELKGETDLGYKLYPFAYMSWQKVKNSYHGIPAITQGVIQNQIYVNTLWALFMIHQKKMTFPKILYDATKIDRWTNKVGQAIGVAGDPNTAAVATSFRGADFSQQAMELVEKTIQYTKEFMGASDAALGNEKADNTSAIIALQKASSQPLELQRLSFYQFVEDYVRVILDMIRIDYGTRQVQVSDEMGNTSLETIDFSTLDYDAMDLNVDVGSSAYWSEITQMQTMDNLFTKGIVTDMVTYLESIPDRYIKNKNKIIESIKQQIQQEQMNQQRVQQEQMMPSLSQGAGGPY